MKFFRHRQNILLITLPWVLVIVLLKYCAHYFGIEFLALNTLFTAIISANVFLLGFLLAGVLADYKESERLPGELTVAIEAIVDEVTALRATKAPPEAEECLRYLHGFVGTLKEWLHKNERTHRVLEDIRGLNAFFIAFEQHLPANFIVRLKQDQSSLRRQVLRIDTIRDTSFVASGYRVAQLNSLFLIVGLIFLSLDPFSNALFFTAVISFLFLYMLALIHDLDNPFSFNGTGAEEVSMKLLDDLEERLVSVQKR